MLHPPTQLPKSNFFGVVFGTCWGRGLQEDIFCRILVSIWVSLGRQFWHLWLICLGDSVFGRILKQKVVLKWEGPAAVLGPMGSQDSAGFAMGSQHARLPPSGVRRI